MKKMFTTVCVILFVTIGFAQTTIVDFENSADYQEYAGWEGMATVADNTLTDGINSSAKVGKYTTPANRAWGNAAVVVLNNPLSFKEAKEMEMMVLAPSATKMHVKLELNGTGTIATLDVTPASSNVWQTLTLNFSAANGIDAETATFDKFVVLFNVDDNVGGEDWYFDNVIVKESQPEPEAPTNLQATNNTGNSFTLTWENDPNATDGTNVFIVDEAAGNDVYITTVGAGVETYTYTGSYGSVLIEPNQSYIVKLQALPDNDWSAYAQLEVNTVATALDNKDTDQGVLMYPNPIKDDLFVDAASSHISQLRVYNSAGSMVKMIENINHKRLISFADLPNGVYFIQIKMSTNETVITQKVIKR